jgi:peptide/nickel transport system substrate-binding protein
MRKWRWLVTLGLVVAVIVALAPTSGGQQRPRGGTLRIGSIADVVYMNPVIEVSGRDWDVNAWMFDQLVVIGGDGRPKPRLAERWETSADGKTVTVFLRKGVTWHDGKPFTARDVEFTVLASLNPKIPSIKRSRWTSLVGFQDLTRRENPARVESLPVKPVVVVDDHTVRFNLAYAYAPFASIALEQAMVPRHLLEQEVREGKDLLTSPFNQRPVGNGPFRFVEWRRDERIVFEANPTYWAGRPKLDRLIYRIIPDRTVLTTELESGGVDFVHDVSFEMVERLRANPRFVVSAPAGLSWWGVIFNTEHALFQDKRVRKAIAHAVDTAQIVREFWTADWRPATGPISPSVWGHNAALQPYPVDLARSRRLLEEAGWRPGPDGRLLREGRPFAFTLKTFDFARERQQASIAIQAALRPLGIDVRTEFLSSPVLLRQAEAGSFEMAFIAYAGFVDPDGTLIRWECANVNAGNISRYCNRELDQLITRARQEARPAPRRQLYQRIQEVLHDELPVFWVTWGVDTKVWDRRFKGFVITPDGRGVFKHMWFAYFEQ